MFRVYFLDKLDKVQVDFCRNVDELDHILAIHDDMGERVVKIQRVEV